MFGARRGVRTSIASEKTDGGAAEHGREMDIGQGVG